MHAHVRSSLHWDLGTTTCSHDDMQKAMERSHVDGKEDITQVQDSDDMYINCIIRIKLVNFALDFPSEWLLLYFGRIVRSILWPFWSTIL